MNPSARPIQVPGWAWAPVLLGLLLAVGGAVLRPATFLPAYLVGWLFWWSIALGSTAVLMLHHLVGGTWGFLIRRPLEACGRTLPALAVLFVPVALGLRHLYPWMRHEGHAPEAWLNAPFFLARAAAYFAIWIALGSLLARWSAEQDRTADPALTRRLQVLSGPGLLLYGLTVTFASIDWVMSLDAGWSSSAYGFLFMAGQGLSALAFALCGSAFRPEPFPAGRRHDLGNLLFAFVMLWAYVSFSQYLIVWSGNIPEEAAWVLRRTRNGWTAVAGLLIVFHFAVPFLLLLARAVKRGPMLLPAVAGMILALRLVDLCWLVLPAGSGWAAWPVPLAAAGLGGLWLALYRRHLRRAPLLPLHDPRFPADGAAEVHGHG